MAEIPFNVISKLYQCIRSVQIKVDSKLILYVDYAKFLIDIMNQKKKQPDEMMYHKFDDVPFEYNAFTSAVGADAAALKQALDINQKTFLNYPLSKTNDKTCLTNLSQKQIALY